MSHTVSVRVRRELVGMADEVVRYGLARSRPHVFSILRKRIK
jgi:hypothetical protein